MTTSTSNFSLDPLPLRTMNPLSLPTYIPGHRLPEAAIRAAGLTPIFVYVKPTAPLSYVFAEGYYGLWKKDGVLWPLPCVSCWDDRGAHVSIVHLFGSGWWTAAEAAAYESARLSMERLADRIGAELAEVVELVNDCVRSRLPRGD